MIDPILQRFFAPYLERLAGLIRGRGQIVPVAAFVIGLVGAALLARHVVWLGLGIFAFALVLSAVAARAEAQKLDFLFSTVSSDAMVFAFALENPERAVSLIFLLFGLSSEAVARTRLGPGLIGEGELLLLFVMLAVFPGGLVAYIAGLLCFVSAGSRRIV